MSKIVGFIKKYWVSFLLLCKELFKDPRLYIILIFIIKGGLLAWSAHPFDFWAFVNTLERYTQYHWNPFVGWNKGNFLFLLWYPLYSLYILILKGFSTPLDNILLLHFIFKVPFLLIDLLTGFLLFKIVKKLCNGCRRLALFAFFLWFANPLVFYAYGIHGQYSIIIPFSFVLIIFGLIFDSSAAAAAGLVLGFQTDYFFIVFIPFIALYILKQRKINFLIKSAVFSLIGLLFSYIQYFFHPNLLRQTIFSVLHLSAVNSPVGVNTMSLPPLNIYSAINYLIEPLRPITNILHPVLFSIFTHYGLYAVALCLCGQFLYRIYSIIYKKNTYSLKVLLVDLSVATFLFPIFLTNFQEHYLLWLVPALILVFCTDLDSRLVYIFTTLTTIGFIYSFRGEFGTYTYFLDIINPTKLFSLSEKIPIIIYREGALIVLLVLLSIGIFFSNSKNVYNEKKFNTFFLSSIKFYFCFVSLLWISIFIPYIQAINIYEHQIKHFTTLQYQKGEMHRGVNFGNYQIGLESGNKLFFANSSPENSHVMEELPGLSVDDQKNFQVFILVTSPITNDVARNLSVASFNSCLLGDEKFGIHNDADNNDYNGFVLDVSCLRRENNVVTLPATIIATAATYSVELYITNKPMNYYFDPSLKNFIYALAVIGILYIMFFCFSSYLIIKAVSKISKNV